MSVFVFLNRELSFAYLERQQQRIHFHISIQLDSHTQERPAGSISSLVSLISHPASDFYFPFQLKSAVQQIPPDIRKMACFSPVFTGTRPSERTDFWQVHRGEGDNGSLNSEQYDNHKLCLKPFS